MFTEMRRKDRAMAEEDTKALLETAQVGILSTVNKDNTPYGVPMNFVYTHEGIYLHCATAGQKLDNIQNNSVCFTVFDGVELLAASFATKYKSAIVFGKITVVEDDAEKRKGLISFVNKYSPDYYEAGLQYIDKAIERAVVLKIEVAKMTGKARL